MLHFLLAGDNFGRDVPMTPQMSVLTNPKMASNNVSPPKQDFNDEDIVISREMRKRLDRINKLCQHEVVKRYKIGFNQTVTRFYFLNSPALSYCKVPKAGSTFWTKKFVELQKTRQQYLNTKTRTFIHNMGNTIQQFAFGDKNATTIYENSINFLVSRDPYTRLFSAYMDKYNLLGHTEFARFIAKKTGKGLYQQDGQKCGYNVNFQDFLDHVVNSALSGQIINRHWAPIFILCHPCSMPYHYLSKQESMNQDTAYIVKTLNLSNAFLKSQNIELQSRGSDKWNRINSIVTTYFDDRFVRNRQLICPDLPLYLKKIWKTLQSQGKISDKVPFPVQEIKKKGKEMTAIEFSDIIFKSVLRNPLTDIQKTSQRRQMLVKYYRNIKPETIEKLKEIYSVDFLLFDYNESPPV